MSWDDASNYLLKEKIALADALNYANKSVESEDRFDNELTKSRVLTALNRKDEAAAAEKRALGLASPWQVHLFARQLQSEKRNDEAFAIFRENATKHPEQWCDTRDGSEPRNAAVQFTVKGSGDLDVDAHHTVEDVGLTLGEALKKALGDKHGIRRFGEATVPLDEALVSVVVDLSGRPFLAYNVKLGQERVGTFDVELVHDFLLALTNQVGMNLHVNMISGRNPHHIVEASFKGLARALSQAASYDPRVRGVLSTKGIL